ncbi:MAG: O-antigen ligase family protein [Phycisphaerae bacterium]
MTVDAARDSWANDSSAARRTSCALALVAAAALAGDCLLTCPQQFSDALQADTSLLKPVVMMLGLDGAFPTERGIEIRNLVYYTAAAALAFMAGLRLLTGGRRPRLSFDDLLDIRRRAASPFFWWLLLVIVSIISTFFSHAPRVLAGQTIVRFLHLAWWLPLAVFLQPRHARRLAAALVAALALTAAIGLWYYTRRNVPGSPLRYPIGNQLWFGACLLPGPFIAAGLVRRRRSADAAGWMLRGLALLAAAGVIVVALALTRSRSAAVGIGAGLFAAVWLLASRRLRPVVLVAGLLVAFGGARYVQSFRPHSIRARLEHQWPYAWVLFSAKPITGHGDGAYSLLAGQIARREQLDDPSVVSFDNETKWEVHTHNEFLELLADLGLVGCAAFVGAIITTLMAVRRYIIHCLQLDDPDRWLVVGLTAAFVGGLVEQCFDNAFRQPGLAPILLSTWAMLWVLVRRHGSATPTASETQRLGSWTVRGAGLAVSLAAVALGVFGAGDWRGVRAAFEAGAASGDGRYEAAVERADFAAGHLLDPFRQIAARRLTAEARALDFHGRIAKEDTPPSEADLYVAQDSLMRLSEINRLAPHFLSVSGLQSVVYRDLVIAHDRRGESRIREGYLSDLVAAVTRCQADDPFRIGFARDLWRLRPQASVMERLVWLRWIMRAGETDATFQTLFQDLTRREDFVITLNDLFNIAARDREQPPDEWRDRLTPETYRIAAMAKRYAGQAGQAAELARTAAALYRRVGPRLFAGRIAALHEAVRFDFADDPVAHTDENLKLLAEAWSLNAPAVEPDEPIPGVLGQTRLDVLIAAGRKEETRHQIATLYPGDAAAMPRHRAEAYLRIARSVAGVARHADIALQWARHAAELDSDLAGAPALILELALRRGDDAAALEAAKEYLDLTRERPAGEASQYLDSLKNQYPASGLWPRLGLPAASSQPASG